VIVVQRQVSNFSAISWGNKVPFWWDDDVCFALEWHALLDFYYYRWNNIPQVHRLFHT